MGGFFNTVTSPEERAAEESADDTPTSSEPRSLRVLKPEDMPMGRIMAAVMRAGAKVQGQEQAKKAVNDQEASRSKMSVTLSPSPTGGPPMVTVKNAPADLLNGTQDADVAKAYTTPKEQVERKLNPQANAAPSAPAPPTSQPSADHPMEQAATALEANGVQVVRPWGDEIKNATSSEEALREVGKRLGIPNADTKAHDAWKWIKAGKLSPQVVQQNLARLAATRLETDSHNLQATLAPYDEKASVRTARRATLAQYLKPGALVSLSPDADEAAQQVDLAIPNGLTPIERRAIINAHKRDTEYGAKIAMKEGDEAVASINPATVIPGETWEEKQHELQSTELAFGHHLSASQLAAAKDRFTRSQQRVAALDAKDRAALEQKNTEIALERERLGVIRQQIAMNSPEAITNLKELVKADPDSYLTIPDKNVQKQVAGALAKEGLPAPQKLSNEERSRVLTSTLGLRDLDALDSLSGKWVKRGVPLTGAVVGRISEAEGSIGSPNLATSSLRDLVPGWGNLSRAEQQQYITDAQTYRSRANNLLVREVKASASGRPSVQLLKMFEPLSLDIKKGGAIRTGASVAARQEFNQAISTIRELQWGGHPPGSAQQPQSGPVLHWNTQKKAWE